jgi:hypothetical protein
MAEIVKSEESMEVSVRTEGFTVLVRTLVEGITEESACDSVEQKLQESLDFLPQGKKSRQGFPFARREVKRRREQLRANSSKVAPKVKEPNIDVEGILKSSNLEENEVTKEESNLRVKLASTVQEILAKLPTYSSEGPLRVTENMVFPPVSYSTGKEKYLLFVSLEVSTKSSEVYEVDYSLDKDRVSLAHKSCVRYRGKGKNDKGEAYKGGLAFRTGAATDKKVHIDVAVIALRDDNQKTSDRSTVLRIKEMDNSARSVEKKAISVTLDTFERQPNNLWVRVSNTKT